MIKFLVESNNYIVFEKQGAFSKDLTKKKKNVQTVWSIYQGFAYWEVIVPAIPCYYKWQKRNRS